MISLKFAHILNQTTATNSLRCTYKRTLKLRKKVKLKKSVRSFKEYQRKSYEIKKETLSNHFPICNSKFPRPSCIRRVSYNTLNRKFIKKFTYLNKFQRPHKTSEKICFLWKQTNDFYLHLFPMCRCY